MAKKLLINADVFADYLMGEPKAREFLESLPEGTLEGTFYYSALTKLELLSAKVCTDLGVRSATSALLALGKRVEVDDAIVNLAAEVKRQYNHNLSVPDSVMVATALQLKAELVTKNIGAFKRIKELLLMRPY